MKLKSIKDHIPAELYKVLDKCNITELRPCQKKAIKNGLLDGKNLLVCTPTASGKTLIAEMCGIKSILESKGKCIYIVPLKSLALEKYKDFKKRYSHLCNIALSIGDLDKKETHLANYDLIICTSEKLDSLIRHHAHWLKHVGVVVIDEIHLLNDIGRGPTLEILITILRRLLANVQIIGLSATIGNPKELANWLDAKLIIDKWRPVELRKGVLFEGKVKFY